MSGTIENMLKRQRQAVYPKAIILVLIAAFYLSIFTIALAHPVQYHESEADYLAENPGETALYEDISQVSPISGKAPVIKPSNESSLFGWFGSVLERGNAGAFSTLGTLLDTLFPDFLQVKKLFLKLVVDKPGPSPEISPEIVFPVNKIVLPC